MTVRKRNRPPRHPGELVREVLVTFGPSIAEAARRMSMGPAELGNVFDGVMPVDADLAVRFERLTGAEPSLYLQMQDEIEFWNARLRLARTLEPFPAERMRACPISTRVNSVKNDEPSLLDAVTAA
jgi:addiction module HigA family antidote